MVSPPSHLHCSLKKADGRGNKSVPVTVDAAAGAASQDANEVHGEQPEVSRRLGGGGIKGGQHPHDPHDTTHNGERIFGYSSRAGRWPHCAARGGTTAAGAGWICTQAAEQCWECRVVCGWERCPACRLSCELLQQLVAKDPTGGEPTMAAAAQQGLVGVEGGAVSKPLHWHPVTAGYVAGVGKHTRWGMHQTQVATVCPGE
jgi:hypothetical protein